MTIVDQMWRDLPEWDFDPEAMPSLSADEAGSLPARTCIHGSPIGPRWKRAMGRGDSFTDWDTNVFHFVGATALDRSTTAFTGVEQEDYLAGRGPWTPGS